MPSCSRWRPRHCAPSPPIRGIWAPRSASSPCSTHGGRRSPTTRISIASCRAADCRLMARAGSPAARISSCPSTCSRASIDACSSSACKQRSTPGACASSATWRGWPRPEHSQRRPSACARFSWVVYAKPPFGSPDQVLAYLGRYTHRVAIANSRLVAIDETRVRFRWRDYRQANQSKLMTLDAPEFIRRFLLHGLPDGFHRIRHYGFLANGHRQSKLALIRAAARPTRTAANPPQRRLSRARARTDRRRSQSLPLLWRRHARHRYLAVHQSAANPASLVSRPMTIRHRARPNSVYAAVVPSRAAARQTACASRQIPDSAPSLAPPEPATPPGPGPGRPKIHGAIAFQTPSRRIPSPPEIDAATKSP